MPAAKAPRTKRPKPAADVAAVVGQLTEGQVYQLPNFCARARVSEAVVQAWFELGLRSLRVPNSREVWVRTNDFVEWLAKQTA